MKFLKYWAAVALLVIVSAVSFYGGREYESYYYNTDNLLDSCEKHYEAACLQADFIRYLIDHFDGETEVFNIGAEIENSYEEWFQELDSGGFKTKYIRSINDFNSYCWCY